MGSRREKGKTDLPPFLFIFGNFLSTEGGGGGGIQNKAMISCCNPI